MLPSRGGHLVQPFNNVVVVISIASSRRSIKASRRQIDGTTMAWVIREQHLPMRFQVFRDLDAHVIHDPACLPRLLGASRFFGAAAAPSMWILHPGWRHRTSRSMMIGS